MVNGLGEAILVMGYQEEYQKKITNADAAVKVVKSGDYVAYSHFVMAPRTLDEALGKRVDELFDVKIICVTTPFPSKAVLADTDRKHFIYSSWHFSGAERKLHDKGLCNYIPFLYHEGPGLYYRGEAPKPNVVFATVAPMDEHGFFNFGTSTSFIKAQCDEADFVILEVNDQVPVCLGGGNESIHISQVSHLIESSWEVPQIPAPVISETDEKIARIVMTEIEDGSCLQLGIGAMPNAVGKFIAQSDLKDLGVHTEMLADSYVDMYEAGRITGKCKQIDPGKMVYTFAMGGKKLYDFLDNNPVCASYDVGYTNDPSVISRNDKVVGINNCVEIDLFGQIASEASGTRQISGTGGQFDFIFGAYRSRGGKGLICLASTYTDKAGNLKSRIMPTLSLGNTVTVPRTVVQYVITEFGKAELKGKSTWERAQALISIAHPDLRDELVKEADKMGLWTSSSKLA
ncbi:MAG: acetyl-CoA hydrolase/transferase family protein [Methylocystaceae bacterium]